MEKSTDSNKRGYIITAIAGSSVLVLVLCCFVVFGFSDLLTDPEPTEDINAAVESIYSTMTMEAAVRNRQIEITDQATQDVQEVSETPAPVTTIAPVSTNTLAPSRTPLPTNTAIPVIPTQPQALPPDNPPSGVCNCDQDYNCSDFSTHSAAQACYISCGGNNWSGLDSDKDGSACESLP